MSSLQTILCLAFLLAVYGLAAWLDDDAAQPLPSVRTEQRHLARAPEWSRTRAIREPSQGMQRSAQRERSLTEVTP